MELCSAVPVAAAKKRTARWPRSLNPGGRPDQVETPSAAGSGIDVLVVTSGDPVWSTRGSWVWERHPLVSADDARAFLMKSPAFAETR